MPKHDPRRALPDPADRPPALRRQVATRQAVGSRSVPSRSPVLAGRPHPPWPHARGL